jgi:hypothetical protein
MGPHPLKDQTRLKRQDRQETTVMFLYVVRLPTYAYSMWARCLPMCPPLLLPWLAVTRQTDLGSWMVVWHCH